MPEIIITIQALPPKQLNPNVGYGPEGKRRLKNDWQETVAWAIRAQLGPCIWQPMARAKLTIEHIIDGTNDRRMDDQNIQAMHKGTVDVLKPVSKVAPWGMGIIRDDNPTRLTIAPYIQTIDPKRAPMTILRIEEDR